MDPQIGWFFRCFVPSLESKSREDGIFETSENIKRPDQKRNREKKSNNSTKRGSN
jgi:hypothetical protein